MIIKALADAAAFLDVPPAGYQLKATPWALTLTEDGTFVSLVPAVVTGVDGKDAVPKQPVPKVTRTVGVAPQLACDTGVYALGLTKPPKRADEPYDPWQPSDRDKKCHDAWVTMIRQWSSEEGGKGRASALLSWIGAGKPGLRNSVPSEIKEQKSLANGNVVIFIEGNVTPMHLWPSAIAHWRKHVAAAKSGTIGLCSACGTAGPLVDTFPTNIPVQLAPGSDQTSGAALTGANFQTASRDLKITQMRNAPTCLSCAEESVAALTALAQNNKHRWRGEDSWTIWWLRSGATPEVMDWLNRPPDPVTVGKVFDQVRAGFVDPCVGDPTDLYYALTYSGRGPRIVIRSWVVGPLSDAVGAIRDYFADSAVESPSRPDRQWEPIWIIAKSAGTRRVRGGKIETVSPPRAHEVLVRAALTGGSAPTRLLSAALARSRAEIGLTNSDDPHIRRDHAQREHARACLVRLILTRSPQLKGAFAVPGPTLDPNNLDPAYLCGRLFAEYESLQRTALGTEINATITDRMYGKAMTNPMLVYPTLDRLAKAHLRKLRTSGKEPAAAAIDRKVTEVTASIGPLPPILDVPGQARWMLGYYQQRAANIKTALAHKSALHRNDSSPEKPTTPTPVSLATTEEKVEAP